MRNTYWQDEDPFLLCFYIACPDERYVIDVFHQTIKKQYGMMGKYEEANPLDIVYPETLMEAKALVESHFEESEKQREEQEQEIWNEIAQEEIERHKSVMLGKRHLKVSSTPNGFGRIRKIIQIGM